VKIYNIHNIAVDSIYPNNTWQESHYPVLALDVGTVAATRMKLYWRYLHCNGILALFKRNERHATIVTTFDDATA